ncbi:hypothetical protein TNIN_84211 [Trichonephila inaurata madagascariensis]|uniref:Uncharacterized protein n=1 Tax=Trichonephila inaurata madagascariensis TaxID=2747483 RepID=A0A8X6Y211_9ARAC|nr:hypothetical protein TNIN_84211 [Trichonephila inaurata madagascariensis]
MRPRATYHRSAQAFSKAPKAHGQSLAVHRRHPANCVPNSLTAPGGNGPQGEPLAEGTTPRPTSENQSFQLCRFHSDAHPVTKCKDQCPHSLLAARKRGSYQWEGSNQMGPSQRTLEPCHQRPGTAFVRGQTPR